MKHLALVVFTVMFARPVLASPGTEVCDIRAIEITWNACQPTGVLVRGACALITGSSADYLGTPGLGYLYFSCPEDVGCVGFANAIANTDCPDFVFAVLHNEGGGLPAPDHFEYPVTNWTECARLKSFGLDKTFGPLGGLDYRQTPDACDEDAAVFEPRAEDAADSGEAMSAGQAAPAPTPAGRAAPAPADAGDVSRSGPRADPPSRTSGTEVAGSMANPTVGPNDRIQDARESAATKRASTCTISRVSSGSLYGAVEFGVLGCAVLLWQRRRTSRTLCKR